MEIRFSKHDIIPVPTLTSAHFEEINDSMEHLSLIRTRIFYPNGYGEDHLNCVMCQQAEIVPMMCAFYGITQSVEPHIRRTINGYRGTVIYKEVVINTEMQEFADQPAGVTERVFFNIYPHADYPRGTKWLIKHGQIMLCSPWGYHQILTAGN